MSTRPEWLRILALAPFVDLAPRVAALAPLPPFVRERGPEIGLAMVRGRAGGEGTPFNLGEMTVTRCTLRVATGESEELLGFACIAGRAPRHAELVAVCDALLQSPRWHDRVMRTVVEPAAETLAERRAVNASRRAATKADFVTVVRSGES